MRNYPSLISARRTIYLINDDVAIGQVKRRQLADCRPVRMQSIIEQIALETDAAGLSVRSGNIVVAYDRGILNYLEECAAVVVLNRDRSPKDRSEYLRQIFPRATEQMDAGADPLPADFSGADAGIALCALGVSPFVVATRDAVLNLDAPGWRIEALAKIRSLYVPLPAAPKQTTEPVTLPAPPTYATVGAPAAYLPEEFLAVLHRMLGAIGFNASLIETITNSIPYPKWQPEQMSTDKSTRVVGFENILVRGSGTEDREVYYAQFSNKTAVRQLLRAVVAVLHARAHVTNERTLDVLPTPLQWTIHRSSITNTGLRGENSFYFAVVVTRPPVASTEAVTDLVVPFMNGLYRALSVYPVLVTPESARLVDGRLRLKLSAFIGAVSSILPATSSMPRLWLQRRDPRATALDWFAPRPVDDSAFNDTKPYDFSAPITLTATPMRIGLHISINPRCRICGHRLPHGCIGLTCAHHPGDYLYEEA